MDYTKTFDTSLGKVVLVIGEQDDQSELRYFARPPGLGTCSFAITFREENDDSYEKAEKAFNEATQESTEKFVTKVFGEMNTWQDES